MDVGTLTDAANPGLLFGPLFLFGVVFAILMLLVTVVGLGDRLVTGAISVGCVLAAVGSFSQFPDADKEIVQAFSAEYPDLTLTGNDINCIKEIASPDSDRRDSCVSNRRVNGRTVKVEFADMDGKFVITAFTGTNVTSDADIQSAYKTVSK